MTGAPIHQILFGWAEVTLTGHRGVGPVAASLPDDGLGVWEQRLLAPEWAAAEAAENIGDARGLLYLRFDDEAVVLSKRSVRDPRGRRGSTVAHALVGPAELLGPGTALGLADWAGWRAALGEHGVLEAVPYERLRAEAASGLAELRRRARLRPREELTGLLRGVLADPAGHFTLITPGPSVPELVCAVVDVLGAVPEAPWTFATHEAAEPSARRRPRIVALPVPPGRSHQAATGHRIRTGEPARPGEERLHDLAAVLAVAYGAGGAETVAALRPATPLASSQDVLAWIPPWAGAVRLLARAARSPLTREEVRALRAWAGRAGEEWESLGSPELAALLADWRDGTGEFADLAERTRVTAVRRGLLGHGAPAPEPFTVPAETVAAELRVMAGRARPAERMALLERAVALGLPEDSPEALELARAVPTSELLAATARCAADRPRIAGIALDLILKRNDSERERRRCAELMAENGFLVPAVEHLLPRDPVAQSRLLRMLLFLSYGPHLADPATFRTLLWRARSVPSPVLLHAISQVVTDDAFRRAALQEAGIRWFAELGLPLPSALAAGQGEERSRARLPGGGAKVVLLAGAVLAGVALALAAGVAIVQMALR